MDVWGRRFDLDTGTFIETRQRIIDYSIANPAYTQIIPWNEAGYANTTYYIADMNGTLIDTFTLTDDTNGTQEAEDFVDEDVIGYPDPENPNPSGWAVSGWLTRFNFKFLIFLIGMVFMVGTPIYGFYARPEGQVWVLIAFSMFIGVALLWSLQTM